MRRAAGRLRALPTTRLPALLAVLLAVLLTGLLTGCAASLDAPTQPAALSGRSCPHDPGAPIRGLPQLDLPCLSGPGTVRVSSMHARVEVINVWASWCYPCRRETRRLDALHRQAGPDVLFLGIDVKDSAAHARAFLAHQGVGYPQATDPDGRFAHALHLFGVPSTLVVDASGQVRWRHDGQLGPADASTLMAQVRSALSAGRLTDGGRATPSAR